MNKDQYLAEFISAFQYITILLLRTDDKYKPFQKEWEKNIKNDELWNIIRKLDMKMDNYPDELQELIVKVRKEKYGIE
jgi:hypothetical protein